MAAMVDLADLVASAAMAASTANGARNVLTGPKVGIFVVCRGCLVYF